MKFKKALLSLCVAAIPLILLAAEGDRAFGSGTAVDRRDSAEFELSASQSQGLLGDFSAVVTSTDREPAYTVVMKEILSIDRDGNAAAISGTATLTFENGKTHHGFVDIYVIDMDTLGGEGPDSLAFSFSHNQLGRPIVDFSGDVEDGDITVDSVE